MKVIGENTCDHILTYRNQAKDSQKLNTATRRDDHKNASEDNVVLSSNACRIRVANRLINSVSHIDHQKVSALTKQINDGNYQVDSRKLAAKLLSETIINQIY